jgi:membrane dipeptidase
MESAADAIHRRAIVVVAHDHRPIGQDLLLMTEGGVTAKVYQISLDVNVDAGYQVSRNQTEGWLQLAARGLENALSEIESHYPRCILAKKTRDIRQAKEEGHVAIFLGAEGARWLEGTLEPLRLFHRLGLRELQLTWAFPNPLVPDGHLSPFGVEVVSECEKLGILVDVTHIPKNAFYEVINRAQRPVIVSHGTAKSITKDLDDNQLRALASTGGLLGVHFYITYLSPTPTPEDVFRQIDYVAELVGIDHIALGVDFFPTEGAWRDLQFAQGAANLRWAVKDMSEMPKITQCLVEHGYSEVDVYKVLGGNFLRVCQEVFGE